MGGVVEHLVLCLPASGDARLPIAGSRAGAAGILDLEWTEPHVARESIRLLAAHGRGRRGVRIGGHVESAAGVLGVLPDAIDTLLVPFALLDELADELATARARGRRLLVEVSDLAQVEPAIHASVDGLVAKGSEGGGWVGSQTTFILLQALLADSRLPVWAHGGIGLHTAAACLAGGAAGVVLDQQLALTRESPLSATVRAAVGRMDGSETLVLGEAFGAPFRIYHRPGMPAIESLQRAVAALMNDTGSLETRRAAWRRAVAAHAGWAEPERSVWPLGQDASFAAELARRFGTVGGVLRGIDEAAARHAESARRLRPLDEGAPLARAHRTRYPIVQGPMTRVSDVPAFAAAVAESGALPFLALALLAGPEVHRLLEETKALLGDQSWGAGILGFVPLELRQEQLAAIRAVRPPFALIAGGRPDQALALEQDGIPTYLHVPSPGLLKMFLEGGARRFVFEGRECGGHVGPRASFVLWNSMIDVLLAALPRGEEAEQVHVLFAGGIHDACSAAMVATAAAPLAERGVKVGVLLGSAYLFTDEAVTSGAIQPAFQDEAVRCTRTVLLETGPGHATRCAATPFADTFVREECRLREQGASPEELRERLEALNLGRLRIASKGVTRADAAAGNRYVSLDADTQRREGMYMIGDLAALRRRVCGAAELHRDVAVGSVEFLAAAAPASAPAPAPRPCDVAVIGIGCMMPQAPTLEAFWSNILHGVNAITEIPRDRFDWQLYFDEDPKVRDKIYGRWGGFLAPVPFDPARYGIPPASLASIEPMQLLVLEAVRAALADAGYATREFPRERTGVVVGVGGGIADLGQQYNIRSGLPMLFENVPEALLERLPEWTEDSFAGIILNVTAGRVANRFNLGGVNYTVDAACASSLAALYAGVRELESGTADVMLVAGADTVQNPFGYLCFAKTRALSARGRCRPFDRSADGTVISEGIGVLVLKRLADAERDGDRIYAVVKAVAGSSDGRDKSMTAPRPEGQVLALERAYATAGVSPATVGLIEAHGTGTVAGDQAEVEALTRVFGQATTARVWCALGSVKSMIGHTKCAAGVAGVIKAALALHHKVLPPTIGVEHPNERVRAGGPFYVNSEARPWLDGAGTPRRAGVSSFGFGGTNFHVVLEEYTDAPPAADTEALESTWPAELVVLAGASSDALARQVDALLARLGVDGAPSLVRVAAACWDDVRAQSADTGVRLAVVASDLNDLREKLSAARAQLAPAGSIADPRGIYFTADPVARSGAIAFLFPGQGSQSVDMLRDLALHFNEVRRPFETASRRLAKRLPDPLHRYVFPPPRFSDDETRMCVEALTRTEIAQPALGAAGIAMTRLLAAFGVRPDLVAGHSYGEYVALAAAGVLDEDDLYDLSEARGRAIVEARGTDLGTMAAVSADRDTVAAALAGVDDVWLANLNAPRQTMISGSTAGVATARQRLETAGITVRSVPVACAFHSPLMREAAGRFAAELQRVTLGPPAIPVFSNSTATPHANDPAAIAATLVRHLVEPVRFVDEIEAMYEAGARIFVEVGPRAVLTGLVRQTLAGRPFVAIATDASERPGRASLLHALAQLLVHGGAVDLSRVFAGRLGDHEPVAHDPTRTWWVSGGKVVAPEGVGTRRPSLGASAPLSLEAPNPAPSPGSPPPPTAPGSVLAPSALPASAGPADEVMIRFQRLMTQFLDTQRDVMASYMTGTGAARAPRIEAAPTGPLPALLAEPAGVSVAPGSSPEPPRAQRDAPQPATQAAVDAAEPGRVDREQIRTVLLAIAAERTGYPPDMLELDVGIEADLGIDSIKRVEIFGELQRALPTLATAIRGSLESLTKAKTLGAIIEAIAALVPSGERSTSSAAPAEPTPVLVDPPAEATTVIALDTSASAPARRCTLSLVDRPLPSAFAALPPGVVLLTGDDLGIADGVAAALAAERRVVVRLEHREAERRAGDADRFHLRLDEADAVERALAEIRAAHGPIAGIIHLASVHPGEILERGGPATWRSALARDVTSLFCLARAAAGDLARPGALLLACTALGGRMGIGGIAEETSPTQAAVAGLVKTLALEWPSARMRVVDLDPREDATRLADIVRAEIGVADESVEVGWCGGRRSTIAYRESPLDVGRLAAEDAILPPGAVVLVTGGARGITAEIAEELAAHGRPTLVLVARQAEPSANESPLTASLESPRELKAALIAQLGSGGRRPAPAEVEAAYRTLLREREVRRRMAGMRRAGAAVVYRQLDVRDPDAVRALVEELLETHGRIDGLVHGAGIIEDKLVVEKDPTSFVRVLETKVLSSFAFATALRHRPPRFFVIFSSVAGRFGNRGQGDYAAANEVLSKLAWRLDTLWPSRVVALDWGPWAGAGMVSEGVASQFAARGVALVQPRAGRLACVTEIAAGHRGEAEVVLGDGPWGKEDEGRGSAEYAHLEWPLLVGACRSTGAGGTFELARRFDLAHDRFLDDHRLDDKAVLPAAVAAELMAEVAQAGWPDWHAVAVRGFRLMRGIVLEGEALPVRAVARVETHIAQEELGLHVDVELFEDGRQRPSYRGTVELAPALPDSHSLPPFRADGLVPYPLGVDRIYRDWLFHGPRFQCITGIEGISTAGMVVTLRRSQPRDLLRGVSHPWLFDPVVLDCAPQLALLWARAHFGVSALPSRFARLVRLAPLDDGPLRCELRVHADSDARAVRADALYTTSTGRPVLFYEGLESTCSEALNRLMGWKGAA